MPASRSSRPRDSGLGAADSLDPIPALAAELVGPARRDVRDSGVGGVLIRKGKRSDGLGGATARRMQVGAVQRDRDRVGPGAQIRRAKGYVLAEVVEVLSHGAHVL